MQTEWGRATTGYYDNEDFAPAVQRLPEELRARVEQVYGQLNPYTNQIKSYHDGLRRVQTGEPVKYDLSGANLQDGLTGIAVGAPAP
jgi:hypothetical protein